MGALREKMIAEMKLRNFAARTQKSYLAAMVGLAKHYRQFPDQLTQEQIRTYVLQLQERGLSSSSLNVNTTATNAGRLISGGGSDNKIQIGCNIHQLPQFVNVSFPDKSRQDGGLSP